MLYETSESKTISSKSHVQVHYAIDTFLLSIGISSTKCSSILYQEVEKLERTGGRLNLVFNMKWCCEMPSQTCINGSQLNLQSAKMFVRKVLFKEHIFCERTLSLSRDSKNFSSYENDVLRWIHPNENHNFRENFKK